MTGHGPRIFASVKAVGHGASTAAVILADKEEPAAPKSGRRSDFRRDARGYERRT